MLAVVGTQHNDNRCGLFRIQHCRKLGLPVEIILPNKPGRPFAAIHNANCRVLRELRVQTFCKPTREKVTHADHPEQHAVHSDRAHEPGDADGVLEDALRAFAGYHVEEVLSPRGESLVLHDTRLLFYYQNRLAFHGLAYDALANEMQALEALLERLDATPNPAR